MASNDKRTGWGDSSSWILGILIGVAIGVSLGVAMANIGAGIAIGAGLGVAFGVAFSQSKKSENPRDHRASDTDR